MSAQLAEIVVYTATDGTPKAAIVTGVNEAMDATGTPDTDDYTPASPASVSLRVFSPTGSTYHKGDVVEGTGPLTYAVKA